MVNYQWLVTAVHDFLLSKRKVGPTPILNNWTFLQSFQLAALPVARGFLSGGVVIFLVIAEADQESRGDQHPGYSFA